MKVRFTKMSGAGNDFVVIDNRSGVIKSRPKFARRVCNRRFGIGADGLLLIEKSCRADFRMMYYNADGSYGGMCGNGGRCISAFAVAQGIAQKSHTFQALGSLYLAEVGRNEATLHMKDPSHIRSMVPMLFNGRKRQFHFVNTGSPHAVARVRRGELAIVEVGREGRYFRNHKIFRPGGSNVNYVEVLGRSSIRIRTYERGVEAETLACGTGSIASAVVAALEWGCRSPVTVQTRGGEKLKVCFDYSHKSIQNVTLTGPATISFEGTIYV